MKRILLSTFMGVLSLAATAQTAQTGQTEQGTSVQVPGYQIELPTRIYRASAGDFNHYKGGYDLSNGDTMVLRSQGQHMYAIVGDRPQVELVAAAPNVFVAVDRQLQMTLEERNSGPIRGELLMVVPRQSAQANATGIDVVPLVASR
jgi:protein gp37